MTPEPEVARVLVVDADPALYGLLEEWLAEEGCRVVPDHADLAPHLVLLDLPLPRQDGVNLVKQLRARHPGAPIVALSSNFFARVEANGAVARALGVAAVLPKPLAREALIGILRRLLPRVE